MRKFVGIVAGVFLALVIFSSQTFAASTIGIGMGTAYAKSNGTYDLTVKDAPGTKLTLYTNDKNPINATVNKSDWATFHKVKLANNTKLSFTKSVTQSRKSTKQAINYTRYASVSGSKVSFSTVNLAVAAAQAKAATSAKAAADAAAKQAAQAEAAQAAATAAASAKAAAAAQAAAASAAASCPNGSYVNSAGNTVCSPAASSSTPSGATAQCSDGTYSYSQSRSGTCSHHGGVATWL